MILSPYDPEWPREFAALRDVYAKALHGLIVIIEHVGSTAVLGLPAKPIIDIDLVMPDYSVFPAIVTTLENLGYVHAGDQGIFQREVFKPRPTIHAPLVTPPRIWTPHHLYVCPLGGKELERHLRFRDELRKDLSLRNTYEEIKRAVAARSDGDRKIYARIKETACRDFVERVLTSPDRLR